MDWGEKAFWFVIVAGSLCAIIFAVIKVGEVVVKRRTDALLAEHAVNDSDEKGGTDDGKEPPSS